MPGLLGRLGFSGISDGPRTVTFDDSADQHLSSSAPLAMADSDAELEARSIAAPISNKLVAQAHYPELDVALDRASRAMHEEVNKVASVNDALRKGIDHAQQGKAAADAAYRSIKTALADQKDANEALQQAHLSEIQASLNMRLHENGELCRLLDARDARIEQLVEENRSLMRYKDFVQRVRRCPDLDTDPSQSMYPRLGSRRFSPYTRSLTARSPAAEEVVETVEQANGRLDRENDDRHYGVLHHSPEYFPESE